VAARDHRASRPSPSRSRCSDAKLRRAAFVEPGAGGARTALPPRGRQRDAGVAAEGWNRPEVADVEASPKLIFSSTVVPTTTPGHGRSSAWPSAPPKRHWTPRSSSPDRPPACSTVPSVNSSMSAQGVTRGGPGRRHTHLGGAGLSPFPGVSGFGQGGDQGPAEGGRGHGAGV
jgi:hypothetical protein